MLPDSPGCRYQNWKQLCPLPPAPQLLCPLHVLWPLCPGPPLWPVVGGHLIPYPKPGPALPSPWAVALFLFRVPPVGGPCWGLPSVLCCSGPASLPSTWEYPSHQCPTCGSFRVSLKTGMVFPIVTGWGGVRKPGFPPQFQRLWDPQWPSSVGLSVGRKGQWRKHQEGHAW